MLQFLEVLAQVGKAEVSGVTVDVSLLVRAFARRELEGRPPRGLEVSQPQVNCIFKLLSVRLGSHSPPHYYKIIIHLSYYTND